MIYGNAFLSEASISEKERIVDRTIYILNSLLKYHNLKSRVVRQVYGDGAQIINLRFLKGSGYKYMYYLLIPLSEGSVSKVNKIITDYKDKIIDNIEKSTNTEILNFEIYKVPTGTTTSGKFMEYISISYDIK